MGPCGSGARKPTEIIYFEGLASGTIPLGGGCPAALGPGPYIPYLPIMDLAACWIVPWAPPCLTVVDGAVLAVFTDPFSHPLKGTGAPRKYFTGLGQFLEIIENQ